MMIKSRWIVPGVFIESSSFQNVCSFKFVQTYRRISLTKNTVKPSLILRFDIFEKIHYLKLAKKIFIYIRLLTLLISDPNRLQTSQMMNSSI